MNKIFEKVDQSMKNFYNVNVFSFEIDKEIKFLNGDYRTELNEEQKQILTTVEHTIIIKLICAVTTYEILFKYYTNKYIFRKYKDDGMRTITLNNLKFTLIYLNSLIV